MVIAVEFGGFGRRVSGARTFVWRDRAQTAGRRCTAPQPLASGAWESSVSPSVQPCGWSPRRRVRPVSLADDVAQARRSVHKVYQLSRRKLLPRVDPVVERLASELTGPPEVMGTTSYSPILGHQN